VVVISRLSSQKKPITCVGGRGRKKEREREREGREREGREREGIDEVSLE
jgi:hypothetical protein